MLVCLVASAAMVTGCAKGKAKTEAGSKEAGVEQAAKNPAKKPSPPAAPRPPKRTDVSKTPQIPEVKLPGATAWLPKAWIRQPPGSPMRVAQALLPRQGTDERDGTMTIVLAGGSVEANVTRWKRQFEGEPKFEQTERQVRGITVHMVRLEGTYLHKVRPMAPGRGVPMPNTVVLAGIVAMPGSQIVFKAWGPKATLDHWRGAFQDMISTVKPDDMGGGDGEGDGSGDESEGG